MRHEFNVGDRVKFKGWEFEIGEIQIEDFEKVKYILIGNKNKVVGVNEEELELVE